MPRHHLGSTHACLLAILVATVVIGCSVVVGATPATANTRCTYLDDNPNGPCYVITPPSGPVGTTVRFRVRVAPQHQAGWLPGWRRHPDLQMFKRPLRADGSHCLFTVPSDSSHWHVIRTEPYDPNAAVNPKAVVGWLTIGESGGCDNQQPHQIDAGRYYLSTSPGTGAFARFRVTSGELPRTGTNGLSELALLGCLLILTGCGISLKSKAMGA